jgi:type II secretory pathway pseudopilin PulG
MIAPINLCASAAARQRGQAMLFVAVLLLLGVSAVIYTLVTPANRAIERDKRTAAALAQARDALIGRAAADDNRPGSLPCPDIQTNIVGTNVPNDGVADLLVGNDCPSYIGRLPWRTLGLPESLRDGDGERLWYAVSSAFRDDTSAQPINSDTAGQLTITGTIANTNVIAIVFSAGAVVGSQVRDIANENVVANYLENGNETGIATNTFISGQATETFNDKLLAITRDVFFPIVEIRVAREIRSALQTYYTANSYYPLAAQFPNNVSTSATYRGYVPTSTSACLIAPDLAPYLPAWFTANNWQRYIVYAVAPRCTPRLLTSLLAIGFGQPCALLCILGICVVPTSIDAGSLNCNNTADGSPAGSWLTVSGTGSVRAIVMPASYVLAAQSRPCNSIGGCLEAVGADSENIDVTDNYVYVTPVRSANNNDNLVIVAP